MATRARWAIAFGVLAAGFPVGWWIRARADVFADAERAGFEYVELALQDVLGLRIRNSNSSPPS